jgi:hypothetical protein
MNEVDEVVAGLEPAMLNSLAEDGYRRNRSDDLSMMAAGQHRASRAGTHRVHAKGRRLVLVGGIAAVGTAAAVAAVVAFPGGKAASPIHSAVSAASPTRTAPSARPSASAPTTSTARAVLLASATVAARSPAAVGTYWYVSEREFEPAIAVSHSKTKKLGLFGATYAETEESWTGQNQARTIVDENLVFSFASAADRARWVAAGKPPLSSAAGFGPAGTMTSNYSITLHWGVGSYQFSVAGIRALPSTAKALSETLENMWAHEPDKEGAVGLPDPTYAEFVAAWADALLTAPSRPGTRAAIYRLLAEQPGLSITPGVTDPLGRVGVAIGAGGGDYLIIQPGTAELLAYTSHPVRADSAMAASDGVEVYELFGWSNQLGVRP